MLRYPALWNCRTFYLTPVPGLLHKYSLSSNVLHIPIRTCIIVYYAILYANERMWIQKAVLETCQHPAVNSSEWCLWDTTRKLYTQPQHTWLRVWLHAFAVLFKKLEHLLAVPAWRIAIELLFSSFLLWSKCTQNATNATNIDESNTTEI